MTSVTHLPADRLRTIDLAFDKAIAAATANEHFPTVLTASNRRCSHSWGTATRIHLSQSRRRMIDRHRDH